MSAKRETEPYLASHLFGIPCGGSEKDDPRHPVEKPRGFGAPPFLAVQIEQNLLDDWPAEAVADKDDRRSGRDAEQDFGDIDGTVL